MKLVKTTYANLTDESLMEEMSNGDQYAFQELYDRYAQSLYRYFYNRMWKDHEKAQDFVHDLMTKLIQKPESFDTKRKFKTWFFSVANNMVINEYKKQSVRSNTQNGLDESLVQVTQNAQIEKQVDDNSFKAALERELNRLDDKHREIFELRHINGMSNKEIAEILKINEGTVKSRVFYAIKQLSQNLTAFKPTLQS